LLRQRWVWELGFRRAGQTRALTLGLRSVWFRQAVRPTEHWREGIAIERREVASGQLDPDDAVMGRLFPESLLSRTDEVLASFESDVRALSAPSDQQVLRAVESVVLALNDVNRT
jgi:hypothetical protein